jgi:hypothetical protein
VSVGRRASSLGGGGDAMGRDARGVVMGIGEKRKQCCAVVSAQSSWNRGGTVGSQRGLALTTQ